MKRFDAEAVSTDAILASVFSASLDCIIVTDEKGRIVELNPAAESTFGRARASAIGAGISDLIVPPRLRAEHPIGHNAYLGSGILQQLGKRTEQTAMRADGSEFPVELAVTETWSGDRRLFVATLRDLTERRAADAALIAGQARFDAFMKHAPIGMYLKDVDGRYIMANPEMAKVFGRPAQEAIGLSAADLFGEDEAAMIAENDRRVLEAGQAIAFEEFLSNAEKYAWSLVVRFPVQWKDQQQARIGGFDIDITELKQSAERLAQSERRFRAVTHHHPVPVVFMDDRNQLIVANPAFREMMGVGPDDEEKFLQHRWFASREDYQHINVTSRGLTRADGMETLFRRLDGSVFPVSLSWRHIEMDGQRVIVGSILDLTDRKAAEAELVRSREALAQSERLNALGSLLAGVSHELNNPLAVVVAQASILEEQLAGAALADRAGKIKRAAERCARIVKTFLAMARERKPERRSVNVNDLIRAALDIASYGLRSGGIDVSIQLADELPLFEADPDQLYQVLFNLIINAQHALQEIPEPRRLDIETARVGNEIEILISDNGPGVPADVRSRIFEPFFTTKPHGVGTGIGLALSMGVVQAHNGKLELLDRIDGAHFRVRLPIKACPAVEAEAGNDQPSKGGARGTALVIDDEPDVAEMIALFLETEGFSVTTVADGASAKPALTKTAFDAIFCDLRMPNTDGPALYDWARQAVPAAAGRFVFVTGDTLGSSAAHFLEQAGRPLLEKPFSRETIRQALAALAASRV